MADKLLTYAKKDSIPHHTVVISDSKSMARLPKSTTYPDLKILTSNRDIEGKEQYYIELNRYKKRSPGRTLVFLETNNESFASNVTSMLNGLNGLTLELQEAENEAEEVEIEVEPDLTNDNNHNKLLKAVTYPIAICQLNFQYPSVYNYKEAGDFGKTTIPVMEITQPLRYASLI